MTSKLPLAAALLCLAACAPKPPAPPGASTLTALPWDQIVQKARGTQVAFAMWTGDELRTRFFRNEIAQILQSKYGIALRIVPLGDTVEGVNKLLNERSAGKLTNGSFDFIWINGENFRTAKQGKVLWGPFADYLPNIRLYDPAIRVQDFGTPIEGFQAPWQKAQFVFAHDTKRTPSPPQSAEALREWVRAHPGRFTYVAPPDFTGSAFLRHILLASGKHDPAFWKGFDEALYNRASEAAIAYLNDIEPYLWRKGETYPPNLRELIRLFANQEVDLAMSYGPSFASRLIAQGQLPPSVRTFLWKPGTLGNYSFLAIAFNSSNPAGAMVAINELMSFETAMAMARNLDPTFPHRMDQLTAAQRAQVDALPRGPATLSAEDLAAHYLAEVDAEYLNRFEKAWRTRVLQQ